MNFNNIRNVGLPIHEADAVPRSFVDEEIKTVMKRVEIQFKELNQLVSVCGSFYGNLKQNEYQFTFGGPILDGKFDKLDRIIHLHRFNGFLVPANGVLKHFATFSSGIILTFPGMSFLDLLNENFESFIRLYGQPDSLVKIFSLVKIEENGKEKEEVGGIYFKFSNIRKNLENDSLDADIKFKFVIAEKFRNKDENFICSVNRGDIINIKSEYTENNIETFSENHTSLLVNNYIERKFYLSPLASSLHLATLTFLFKEMSFPNVLDN